MPCAALHARVNGALGHTIEQRQRPSKMCTQRTSDDDDQFQVCLGPDNDIPGRLSHRSLHSMYLLANLLFSEGRRNSANLLPHHRPIETTEGCHARVQSSCSACTGQTHATSSYPAAFTVVHLDAGMGGARRCTWSGARPLILLLAKAHMVLSKLMAMTVPTTCSAASSSLEPRRRPEPLGSLGSITSCASPLHTPRA